jgi:predicted SnoaL-like aldol condensation-catalyzing enzyme
MAVGTVEEKGMNEQLERNKRLVREYYELAFNEKKPEEAVAKYQGSYYRQHNPQAADGGQPFIGFVHYMMQTYPEMHMGIKRMVAEGDLVVTHSHLVRGPGDRGQAVMDIFRLEDGKIVEHWDVLQDVPEKSENNNSMF